MFPLRDNIPLARFPVVTVALVAINAVAYVLAVRHGGSFFGGPSKQEAVRYGAIPYELTHPGRHCQLIVLPTPAHAQTVACLPGRDAGRGAPATPATVLTSMFLHGSFLQILGNMFFLALFGPAVEDRLGRVRYIALYLAGGLLALAAQVLIGPDSTSPALGSSGAVAAVLGGYLVLYPRARVLGLGVLVLFVTIIELPAIALLAGWFPEQLAIELAGLASPIGGGEAAAYLGYLASFLLGALVIGLLARPRTSKPPLPVY